MPDMLCRALVLGAAPGTKALTGEHRAAALKALAGFQIIDETEADPGEVWRLLFVAAEDIALPDLRHRLRHALGDAPLDINVTADDLALTRKRLLVADMESTIIEQEMLDELGDIIGRRAEIEDITMRAMRGELDFEAALEERVAMLAGLDAGVLDDVARRITLMPGAETLVATMKANGAYCALVSGGFTCFTAPVARRLGFDEHQANTLEIVGGKISGRVVPPILGRRAKRAALDRLTRQLDIDPVLSLAVGDGANDLDMLTAAGLGVAFHAKPKVREAASSSPGGAVISHGDLTALLHLQGYRSADFVSHA